jgi:superfamily I DNA and/or RNA helicase
VNKFLRARLLSQSSYSHLQAGLEVSLFEQLQSNGVKTFLLDTQYRMHPQLAAFPSERFYGGLLRSFPRPEDRLPPKGYDLLLQRSSA